MVYPEFNLRKPRGFVTLSPSTCLAERVARGTR